jgi:meckelin
MDCSVDIFFLDWEKPRRVLAKGGGREEPGPISAWRGLLVANEWNELQTSRLTCPSFTLLFMVSTLLALHFLVYCKLALWCRL